MKRFDIDYFTSRQEQPIIRSDIANAVLKRCEDGEDISHSLALYSNDVARGVQRVVDNGTPSDIDDAALLLDIFEQELRYAPYNSAEEAERSRNQGIDQRSYMVGAMQALYTVVAAKREALQREQRRDEMKLSIDVFMNLVQSMESYDLITFSYALCSDLRRGGAELDLEYVREFETMMDIRSLLLPEELKLFHSKVTPHNVR